MSNENYPRLPDFSTFWLNVNYLVKVGGTLAESEARACVLGSLGALLHEYAEAARDGWLSPEEAEKLRARIRELETPTIFWEDDDPETSLSSDPSLFALGKRKGEQFMLHQAHALPSVIATVELHDEDTWPTVTLGPAEPA